jgi:gamma-glutamylcyclotransferase (GGCT)/AIG2-like uncharacterized protein YtfP
MQSTVDIGAQPNPGSKLTAQGSELLFVYGSLRRGFDHHYLLRQLRAEFIGRGKVRGELFDLGRYPGAVKSDSSNTVSGEIYRLKSPDSDLKALDDYEGVGSTTETQKSEYRRELTQVTIEDSGAITDAWIYWMNCDLPEKHRIASGDYSKG